MHPAAPGWLLGTHPRGGQILGSLNTLATPPAFHRKVPAASALCLAICLGITLLIPSSHRKTPCSASTGTIWEKIQRAQASALEGKSLFLAQQTYVRFGYIQTHLNLSPQHSQRGPVPTPPRTRLQGLFPSTAPAHHGKPELQAHPEAGQWQLTCPQSQHPRSNTWHVTAEATRAGARELCSWIFASLTSPSPGSVRAGSRGWLPQGC